MRSYARHISPQVLTLARELQITFKCHQQLCSSKAQRKYVQAQTVIANASHSLPGEDDAVLRELHEDN